MAEVGGEPVCGCDGAWHPTKRDAQLAGVDVSWSACTPPSPEYVQCGYKFCDRGRSFCLIVADECSTEPFCVPLPPACGGGDPCACIDAQQLCRDYDYSGLTSPSGCDMSTAGDLKLTCIA